MELGNQHRITKMGWNLMSCCSVCLSSCKILALASCRWDHHDHHLPETCCAPACHPLKHSATLLTIQNDIVLIPAHWLGGWDLLSGVPGPPDCRRQNQELKISCSCPQRLDSLSVALKLCLLVKSMYDITTPLGPTPVHFSRSLQVVESACEAIVEQCECECPCVCREQGPRFKSLHVNPEL